MASIFKSEKKLSQNDESPKYTILGLLKDRFALIENDEGLMIMSKRSAHERVLYEQALKKINVEGKVPIQKLLVPVSMDFKPDEFEFIFKNEDKFKNLGFVIEKFGGNTIKLEGVPAYLETTSIEDCFISIVTSMIGGGLNTARDLSMEDLISSVSVMASKYFDSRSLDELQILLGDLLDCDMPYVDTRGRPTLYQISFKDIERKLGIK